MADEENKFRQTDKKVDESWKDKVEHDKATGQPAAPRSRTPEEAPRSQSHARPSKPFLNLLTSLGYQALMHLGEISNPETNTADVDLDRAREIIDLLAAIKEKTEGNLAPEESQMIVSLVSELQMKYANHA